ncbi:hypothetical protein PHYBLDRAFT_115349 [Phycomyces blakesleeanus NRRL 1555(-)]|uniref:Fungal lipase-type domain-containing protein n=1 Tax=Phycomyces blakesleeanus (strain ATCC 8743b / DSM 1359 / FGSC 10004 / NBRC 33097 / NRRL 1555) TaxID=763407 RepID=A0A162TSG7_PHYB8|nr:hypothetical protein PHYBLDRAFT_115349 [Phycomyces blakesleeanus NRRL 1555(-)]OAD70672.1 hypothetical protein PHYBLDRAFT_115349 [Phycomyces blakesleeanus NRRL 1555(-)]|eukprot:XP_018288712.1 hypothetical protein PHYBLDRAFT_115349 [Phycomyces blakesleeanus NRRL 1555(-)]
MAAPVNEGRAALVSRDYSLPPIIKSRANILGKFPKVDLTAEATAKANNGPLPENVQTTDGIAVNATSGPSQAQTLAAIGNSVSIATEVQVQDLKVFTQLSANVYCRVVVPLNQWACAHCSKDETLVSTFFTVLIDTNGFITRNDKSKTISLVFRGTYIYANLYIIGTNDFDFITVDYSPVKNAKIHGGFYKAYLDVQEPVISKMIEQITEYPNYKVAVSGHSLGGSLAEIAAMDLYQRDTRFNSTNIVLHTYGQPRTGNSILGSYFTGTGIEYKRTVHDHNMIPHLPPLSVDYMHVGTEYWETETGPVKICTDFESIKCSNSIVPFTSATDHLSYFGINTGLCL